MLVGCPVLGDIQDVIRPLVLSMAELIRVTASLANDPDKWAL